MNSILNLTTLFIILNVGFCSSCKDKDEPETNCTPDNTVLVPQDMKDRFFFKVGTYWIYKNLQTNETDSIWVWISYNNPLSVNREDFGFIKDKCYETFTTNTMSKKIPNNSNYNRWGIDIYPKEGKKLTNELFGLEDATSLTNYFPNYRIEVRGGVYENQSGSEITMLDSITTQDNIVYKDVLWLKYQAGILTRDYLDDMHYAKNIGLVKFHRFTDTSDWELIRYKIIQ